MPRSVEEARVFVSVVKCKMFHSVFIEMHCFLIKVKRTRDRPLACGELRMRHATGWLATQLSAALAILCHLNPPCFIIGVGSLGKHPTFVKCFRLHDDTGVG